MPKNERTYEDREKLDSELEAAIGEIMAAEAEARQIIERAEAQAKSVALDAAAQERTMRESHVKLCAASREKKLADATKKADEECDKLVADAKASGEKLIVEKKKAIQKRAEELFSSLGGK